MLDVDKFCSFYLDFHFEYCFLLEPRQKLV